MRILAPKEEPVQKKSRAKERQVGTRMCHTFVYAEAPCIQPNSSGIIRSSAFGGSCPATAAACAAAAFAADSAALASPAAAFASASARAASASAAAAFAASA